MNRIFSLSLFGFEFQKRITKNPNRNTMTASPAALAIAGLPVPPTRDVARPVSNLGNTCYMNAVLQALAHAPELCLAMDCNPHHITCPVALENRKRRISSPTSSPEDTSASASAIAGAFMENDFRRKPARKLRRSSRKSPTNGMFANTTNTTSSISNQNNAEGSPANNTSAIMDDGSSIYCALCEMEWHLQEVHAPSPKDKAVAPSFFVHGFIDHVAPHFKLGQQEDSHEFLRLLIDAMQHSCKNARPKSEQDDPMEEDIPPIGDDAAADTNTNSNTNPEEDTEYPFQLFRGTVESCVTCDSCKASSSTLDPIEDVGLEVTPPSPSTSTSLRATPPSSNEALADVTSAFRRFARVEDLDSGYKCEKCGKGGRATKQSRLASIPPILTLHLKRFRYGADARGPSQAAATGASNRRTAKSGSAKIEGHIKFEQIFDLKPYLTDELQAKQKAMFCRLFAVVVHAGKNSHSGHYIAYVRNIQKNEWWKMDDARVTLVGADEVMQAEAYMLFYRVVEHPFALHLKEKTKKLQEAREAVASQLAAESAAEGHKTVAAGAEAEKENVPAPATNQKATESPEAVPGPAPKVIVAGADKNIKHKVVVAGADKNIMQEAAISSKATVGTTKPASTTTSGTNTNTNSSRKRALPDFTDGKSWAKAKTRLKPAQYSKLRMAEEYVNENVQLKPEFFKIITEEGSKDSAKVNHCPIKRITGTLLRHF